MSNAVCENIGWHWNEDPAVPLEAPSVAEVEVLAGLSPMKLCQECLDKWAATQPHD